MRLSEVTDAWSAWLGQEPFDAFLTMTSDHVTHPEALLKRFYLCRNLMNRAFYGKNWHRRDFLASSAVVGMERHKSGNPHCHAVMRIPGGLTIRQAIHWQKVFTETGGFSRLDIPRSQVDVVSYVTKYVVKGGELEMTPNFVPINPFPELRHEIANSGNRSVASHEKRQGSHAGSRRAERRGVPA